jgi:hypothetical protein
MLRGRWSRYAIDSIPQSTPLRDGFFLEQVELICGWNAR